MLNTLHMFYSLHKYPTLQAAAAKALRVIILYYIPYNKSKSLYN